MRQLRTYKGLHLQRKDKTRMLLCSDFLAFFLAMSLFVTSSAKSMSTVCGRHRLYADLSKKYLTSPNWPLEYPSNIDCYYVIEPIRRLQRTKSVFLELNWLEFDINGYQESCHDFLNVSVGTNSKRNFSFCSKNHPHPIISANGQIALHFHSDQKDVGFGFKASFRLILYAKKSKSKECGGKITNKEPRGIIQSPNWPKMAAPCSCVFQFDLAYAEVLQLNIMDFSIVSHISPCNDFQAFDNCIDVRVSSRRHSSFHRSCSVFSMSNCERRKKWSISISRRTVFVHINLLKVDKDARGFLAGYVIYQRKPTQPPKILNSKARMFDVVVIGAIAGVLIGVFIVIITSLGVKVCLKTGVL